MKKKANASPEKVNQAVFSKRTLLLIVSYLFSHSSFRRKPDSSTSETRHQLSPGRRLCATRYNIFTKPLMTSFQRGSILIGIIVTMVVMAVLGTGMLYLTTTSTFNELFFGNHSDAYFVAESGGRFAKSVIRDAYANDISKLNAINSNQTFTLANGNSFQIMNFSQSGNPKTITFASIGMVGSGLMQAKRQINYSIQPANQTGVPTGPSGPINFNSYSPTPFTGGGKIDILQDGSGLTLNFASGGKNVTVLSNDIWTYPGDYAVQLKLYDENRKGSWHAGLFVNMMKNGTALPYGYGITFYNVWDGSSQLNFATALPVAASGSPIVLLWQHSPTHGLNWIAYATLDDHVMVDGIDKQKDDWYLGATLADIPTILVNVTRNTGSNDIQVYLAGPKYQPSYWAFGDNDPINYDVRRAYTKWSAANATSTIKWPSTVSSMWYFLNDFFTLIYSEDLLVPAIAKWFRNPNFTNVIFQDDTTTIPGTSIYNAIIHSTIMTGSEYTGVGLFVDPIGQGTPKIDFFNLGIKSSTVSDGSGTEIQF